MWGTGQRHTIMADFSSTLRVGDAAPPFSLAAANSGQLLSLAKLLHQGALVVEFLRGTW
jgi:peroxiredoxin